MTVPASKTINNDLDVGRKIPGTALADNAVTADKIAPGAVGGDIEDLSITGAKLALLAVDTPQLAAGAISADAAGRALMAADLFDAATVNAKIAAGVIAATKLALTGIKTYGFNGRNNVGLIALTGAAVGDRVLALFEHGAVTLDPATSFESTITVVDEIQQSDAGDLTLLDYVVILIPAAA
jgi:hypothetical protein